MVSLSIGVVSLFVLVVVKGRRLIPTSPRAALQCAINTGVIIKRYHPPVDAGAVCAIRIRVSLSKCFSKRCQLRKANIQQREVTRIMKTIIAGITDPYNGCLVGSKSRAADALPTIGCIKYSA
jgi:hypothetical protein